MTAVSPIMAIAATLAAVASRKFPAATAEMDTTAFKFAAVNSAVVAAASRRALFKATVPAVQTASAAVWA